MLSLPYSQVASLTTLLHNFCLFFRPHRTAPLHAHLQEQGVEYMQFAFRWMNCLLMREMSVRNIIRMWDTYLVSTKRAKPLPQGVIGDVLTTKTIYI